MIETRFTRQGGIQSPIIGAAMYPSSNPELVAAVSEAGGLGMIQPMSLIYVYGYELRKGIKLIRSLTMKPIGFNALIEKTAKVYEQRMRQWVTVALEEGIRFFVTALGNPRWVIEQVHDAGGIVYHDVTDRSWALKAMNAGADGLICVNNRAGGHAGGLSPQQLYEQLIELGAPLICSGGIGDEQDFCSALSMGYDGVQMGTRFIAAAECQAHADYKNAILKATSNDIVLTDKISGVPVSVIRTPYIDRMGITAGFFAKKMLRGRKTKRWMRMYYSLVSGWKLRKANLQGDGYNDFYQAGKSVDGIHEIEPAARIIERLVNAYQANCKEPTA